MREEKINMNCCRKTCFLVMLIHGYLQNEKFIAFLWSMFIIPSWNPMRLSVLWHHKRSQINMHLLLINPWKKNDDYEDNGAFDYFFAPPCFFSPALAETKTFIQQYTDQVSRDSSRRIALREVKRLLLEDWESTWKMKQRFENFQLTKDRMAAT